MTKQAKFLGPLKSANTEVSGFSWLSGRQVSLCSTTVPTQTPEGARLHRQTSRVSCLLSWRIPKCFFEFFLYNTTICCGMQPPWVAGKRGAWKQFEKKTVLGWLTSKEKSRWVNMSYPFYFSHNHDLCILSYGNGGEGGRGTKTKKTKWKKMGKRIVVHITFLLFKKKKEKKEKKSSS